MMNKLFYLPSKGLAFLETAIISSFMLALFFVVLAMSERLMAYNTLNQILSQELNNQRLSALQDDFLLEYLDRVKLILQEEGFDLDDYQAEVAFVKLQNHSINIAAYQGAGNLDQLNQDNLRVYLESYDRNLPVRTLLSSRLIVKQSNPLVSLLAYLGMPKYVYAEKISRLRL